MAGCTCWRTSSPPLGFSWPKSSASPKDGYVGAGFEAGLGEYLCLMSMNSNDRLGCGRSIELSRVG